MLKSFIIRRNDFLSKDIQSYYSLDYVGYEKEGNPDFINHLKNHFDKADDSTIQIAKKELSEILYNDLPRIRELHNAKLSVCVVPRAKSENYYSDNQKVFRQTISEMVCNIPGFEGCAKFILRKVNTITTHMNKSGYGGDGDLPYIGITKATCDISNDVYGRDILLIDDIYTKGVNIDEDVIQSLLDFGARSVIFYAVGRTFSKSLLLQPHLKKTFTTLEDASDLETIIHIVGLRKQTIIKHLSEISSFLGIDSIMHIKPNKETLHAVESAALKVGRERLKPIFEELKGQYSYEDIKLSLLFIE